MNNNGRLRPAMAGIGGAGGEDSVLESSVDCNLGALLDVGSASSSRALRTSAKGGISTMTIVCRGEGIYRPADVGEPGAPSRVSNTWPPGAVGIKEFMDVRGPGGVA